MILIDDNGLIEGIRCALCTNNMANDRGCDGGCVVNEYQLKKVLDVIDKVQIKNPTNGDMIMAMFPNIAFTEMANTVHATTKVTSNGVKGGICYDFWKEWWNAPYGEGSEDKV